MPELGSYGSVRGAAGNSRPYRECRPLEGRRRVFGGRRPKASEEPRWGNVGRCRVPELSRDRTRKPAIWTRRP